MERPLRILLVDDEDIVHRTIGDYLRKSGHEVDEARNGLAALAQIEKQDYELSLVDVRMPGLDGMALLEKAQELRPEMSVVIVTGHGNMDTVVQALRLGAADFLTKPIKLLELDASLEKCLHLRALQQDRRHLREVIREIQASGDHRDANWRLVGDSEATGKAREEIRRAVEAGCQTIVVTGETGTGKEVVSRELHFQASSGDSPFIAVSCPALPDSLIESELFGHVKGAFTGATEHRAGYFELADGGTIFLDEIGDLSPAAQLALLRVLETRTLRRVGGSEEVQIDVRVIAATNAPLEELVNSGEFRRDLFYRLNVYTIRLRPLRERQDDILPLAEHFLSAYAATRHLHFDGFSVSAQRLLREYDYPGNVRELRNIVERAAILCRSGQIETEHLNLPDVAEAEARPAPASTGAREDEERDQLLKALEEARWNRRQAAKALNMPYSTLRYKLSKLQIK